MAKCSKHIVDESYQEYCFRCEEENYKHMSVRTVTSPDLISTPDDKITISVMKDLALRADRGLQKYNTTLGENNHQNMLQHAYEEALDLAQYLKKEITTLNTVQDLVKQYPNDIELGAVIRDLYGQK